MYGVLSQAKPPSFHMSCVVGIKVRKVLTTTIPKSTLYTYQNADIAWHLVRDPNLLMCEHRECTLLWVIL